MISDVVVIDLSNGVNGNVDAFECKEEVCFSVFSAHLRTDRVPCFGLVLHVDVLDPCRLDAFSHYIFW